MPETTSVVVVHGLWMTGVESLLLRRQLEAQTGWAVRRFRYHSVTAALEDIARDLSHFIASLPSGPVHVVAHSLGGLVTYETMHRFGPGRSGRVVLLCSPVQGSAAAARLARWPGGLKILGKSVRSTLLSPSRRRVWEAAPEAGVIAGTRSMGLGRIVAALDGPNDGTVAVAETRLAGAADSIELPVSHSSALFSPLVAAQAACFLARGRFRRGGQSSRDISV